MQTTLESMVGRVTRARTNLDRSLAISMINERMRSVMSRNPMWSGLQARTVISIPSAYTAGSITLTTGLTTVAGDVNTAWPVGDILTTTLSDEVLVPQQAWVQLASMAGVTATSIVYIDGGGATPEILPVLDVRGGRVLLNFLFGHGAGVPVTISSLNGMQMRTGPSAPIYTVTAVTSPTTLELDNPWGGPTMAGAGYQLILMYTPIAPDMGDLMMVSDPVQQRTLNTAVSQLELNRFDPTRTATDDPSGISPLGPNQNGQQLYEIYPPQVNARQLYVMYKKRWPNMRLPQDMPPPFLDENILVYGALADAFITPSPRGPEGKDPGYNPQASQFYETKFQEAYIDCLTADQSKAQTAYTRNLGAMGFGFSARWQQSHLSVEDMGNF